MQHPGEDLGRGLFRRGVEGCQTKGLPEIGLQVGRLVLLVQQLGDRHILLQPVSLALQASHEGGSGQLVPNTQAPGRHQAPGQMQRGGEAGQGEAEMGGLG